MKRIGLLSAAVVAGMLVTAVPALATEAGVANAGAANFKKGNSASVVVETLAPCSVEGPVTASSPAVTKTGVKFGATTSTCETTVVNPDDNITTTKSEAKGVGFELSALVPSGPRLKIGSWRITCNATQTGTNAGWQLGGMSGWTGLPQQIPANYVHDIKKSDGTVLAKAKFAEVILPEPNDGSIKMNLIRITFEPASGYSGTIDIGSAACSPTP